MQAARFLKAKNLFLLLFLSLSCSSNPANSDEPEPDINIEPSRVQVTTFATLTAPDGLGMDKDGNLYAGNFGTSRVFKIDTTGATSLLAQNQPGAAGLIFDENNIMYLARYNSGEVVRMTTDGNVIDTVASQIQGPIAVTLDGEGGFFANNNLAPFISRVDSVGRMRAFSNHGVNNSSSLTVDDEGDIYVSFYGTGLIAKIDRETRVARTFTTLPIQGIGFIVYSKGFLYATAIQDHFIYRINMDGNADIIAGTGEQGNIDGPGNMARFHNPNGLVASPDGKTLFVAENGFIRKITNFRD